MTVAQEHFVKVQLVEDKAHGLYPKTNPYEFWLSTAVNANELRATMCFVAQNPDEILFIGVTVGPSLFSLQEFAREWHLIVKEQRKAGKLTHAYWDFYQADGYTKFGSMDEFHSTKTPPERRLGRQSFKTQ
jgi:hypothetical protein